VANSTPLIQIRGTPFLYTVHAEATATGETIPDLATLDVALILDKHDKRITLDDGEVVDGTDPPRVEFSRDREWSRVEGNLPPGDYATYVRVGPSTGTDGLGVQVGTIRVVNPPSGEALS
jgi:hypothetical protein